MMAVAEAVSADRAAVRRDGYDVVDGDYGGFSHLSAKWEGANNGRRTAQSTAAGTCRLRRSRRRKVATQPASRRRWRLVPVATGGDSPAGSRKDVSLTP